jgi:penicillin amidase
LITRGKSLWFDDPDTAEVEELEEIIAKSFKEAVIYLESQMGSKVDDWKWRKIHPLTFYHPFGKSSAFLGYLLNIGPFPMGGRFATVNPQSYRLSDNWCGYHVAALRYSADLSNMKNSRRVILAGISGNLMSRHCDEQVALWRNGKYRPFVLNIKSVEADARHTLVMLPD